jgi:ACR3 family arsenite efflux pump ArsB
MIRGTVWTWRWERLNSVSGKKRALVLGLPIAGGELHMRRDFERLLCQEIDLGAVAFRKLYFSFLPHCFVRIELDSFLRHSFFSLFPFMVLLYAVITFIVVPVTVGMAMRAWVTRQRGKQWFEQEFLPRFSPVTGMALLATLVFIFAFQADNITGRYLHVLLIAIPILIRAYFNSTLAYGLMRLLKVQYSVAALGA